MKILDRKASARELVGRKAPDGTSIFDEFVFGGLDDLDGKAALDEFMGGSSVPRGQRPTTVTVGSWRFRPWGIRDTNASSRPAST